MFWDMALVLKATQEAAAAAAASAAAPLGGFSLPGTLAKSEILEPHGIPTLLGKVQLPDLSHIKMRGGCLFSFLNAQCEESSPYGCHSEWVLFLFLI